MRLSPRRSIAHLLSLIAASLVLSACSTIGPGPTEDQTPAVGDRAPGFTLNTVDGKRHSLDQFTKDGPVVLLVLRGYPGYQCPICSRQVGDYITQADAFAKHDATVVMVYPGPAEGLDKHAGDFIAGKGLPKNFVFLTDPDYVFTNKYGLRWDAPRETAYPSTFVISKGDREVKYAYISRTHGDRTKASDILDVLGGE